MRLFYAEIAIAEDIKRKVALRSSRLSCDKAIRLIASSEGLSLDSLSLSNALESETESEKNIRKIYLSNDLLFFVKR